MRRDGNLFTAASNPYADSENDDRGILMTTDRGSEARRIGPQEVNDAVECERLKYDNIQKTSGQSCNRASAPSLCSKEASISQDRQERFRE